MYLHKESKEMTFYKVINKISEIFTIYYFIFLFQKG